MSLAAADQYVGQTHSAILKIRKEDADSIGGDTGKPLAVSCEAVDRGIEDAGLNALLTHAAADLRLSAIPLEHDRHDGAVAVEDPVEIDADHSLPFIDGILPGRAIGPRDAGRANGKIGEIWYERRDPAANEPSLLLKLLFTLEPLSVQVHPGDAFARSMGEAHGKSDHFRTIGPKMGPSMAGRPDVQYFDAI